MKKIFLSLVIAAVILGGCSFITKQILKNKSKSFVQVMALSIVNANGDVRPSMASGFVVADKPEGTYILTAGHFCVNAIAPDGKVVLENVIYVNTLKGNSHRAILVGLGQDVDVCLLRTKNLGMEPLEMSLHPPSKYDEVLNIAAPAGLFGKDVAIVYEGRFIGTEQDPLGPRSVNVYNLPAFPGSSGSPILNRHGHVIGMVVSTARDFYHMAFSPNHTDILNFLEEHLDLEGYNITEPTLIIE